MDPSTEAKICDVQRAGTKDCDLAIAAARACFDERSAWRTMSASERGRLLYKLADLIEANLEEIANLEA